MKKFSVVLAAAGLTASLGAYATLPTDAAPFSLNIPNLKSGLEITLEGLLVRPEVVNPDYATTSDFTVASGGGGTPNPYFALNNDKDIQSVNPNYDFGFRVGLGYVFPDSGNDIQVNWTHFDQNNSNSTNVGDEDLLTTSFGVPLISPALLGLNGDVYASSTIKSRFDAIDLDVGQYVNIGTRLQTRLFGGLRYAYVQQRKSNDYNASYGFQDQVDGLPFLTYDEHDSYSSKFNGLGPRMGFQAAYNVYNCFGVTGSIASSLLVGKVKSNANSDFDVTAYDNDPDGTISRSFQPSVTSSSNIWRIVPEVDARVGLNYTWLFINQSALTLEAGYQVTQYFNAVDTLSNNVTILNGPTTTRQTSDVGYDGPYLSLNYKM